MGPSGAYAAASLVDGIGRTGRRPVAFRLVGGLAGGEPLDDAGLGPLASLDRKALGVHLAEGSSQEVIASGQPADQPLDGHQQPVGAADMVEQEQPPTRAEHPVRLGNGAAVIGDGAQRQGADDGVEGGVGERQSLGVSLAELDRQAEPPGAVSGDLEHGGAQVDPGEPNVLRIEGEVAAGADRDLQDLSGRLGADPCAPVIEQAPLEPADAPVVAGRAPVPPAPGRGRGRGSGSCGPWSRCA
jgi:hypothetical protein